MGDAEVDELDDLAAVIAEDDDVAGLHVAVHDAGLVGGGEAVAQLEADGDGVLHAQLAARGEEPLQRAPTFEHLEHDVGRPAGGDAAVEDVDDRGMTRRGKRASLAHETGPELALRSARAVGGHQLQRDAAMRELVARLEDDAGGAAPQIAHQLVAIVDDVADVELGAPVGADTDITLRKNGGLAHRTE